MVAKHAPFYASWKIDSNAWAKGNKVWARNNYDYQWYEGTVIRLLKKDPVTDNLLASPKVLVQFDGFDEVAADPCALQSFVVLLSAYSSLSSCY